MPTAFQSVQLWSCLSPSIVSKILKRHIYMLIIIDHLEHNHPLSTFQWGVSGGKIYSYSSAASDRSMVSGLGEWTGFLCCLFFTFVRHLILCLTHHWCQKFTHLISMRPLADGLTTTLPTDLKWLLWMAQSSQQLQRSRKSHRALCLGPGCSSFILMTYQASSRISF